jgi:hypothetical protein
MDKKSSRGKRTLLLMPLEYIQEFNIYKNHLHKFISYKDIGKNSFFKNREQQDPYPKSCSILFFKAS